MFRWRRWSWFEDVQNVSYAILFPYMIEDTLESVNLSPFLTTLGNGDGEIPM